MSFKPKRGPHYKTPSSLDILRVNMRMATLPQEAVGEAVQRYIPG